MSDIDPELQNPDFFVLYSGGERRRAREAVSGGKLREYLEDSGQYELILPPLKAALSVKARQTSRDRAIIRRVVVTPTSTTRKDV